MWRFWRALPAKGKIGVLFGNWYTDPINVNIMVTAVAGRLRSAGS